MKHLHHKNLTVNKPSLAISKQKIYQRCDEKTVNNISLFFMASMWWFSQQYQWHWWQLPIHPPFAFLSVIDKNVRSLYYNLVLSNKCAVPLEINIPLPCGRSWSACKMDYSLWSPAYTPCGTFETHVFHRGSATFKWIGILTNVCIWCHSHPHPCNILS